LGDGANSALWYGNRLMQFPLGVFGIAMGTALLPAMSHQVARNNFDEVKSTLSFSLRSVFFVVIPASVGLIILSEPIVRLCFERGQFDAVATMRTARTLVYYCIGLFAYSGVKLVVSAFYSLQDTKTPVRVGVFCMLLNIVCNLIFMQFLREAGLALATSVSSTANFLILYWLLRRRIGSFEGARIVAAFLRILGMSACMGVAAYYTFQWWPFTGTSSESFNLFLRLMGTIGISVVVYGIAGIMFCVPEMRHALSHICRKTRPTSN